MRVSLIILLTLAACSTTAGRADEEVGEPASFREALEQGRQYLKFRLRAEGHDQGAIAKDATAVTLRTVYGYESMPYDGFGTLLEFENVSALGGQAYNSTTNGKVDRPVIADPTGTEVNQVYMQQQFDDHTTVRGGRQRIILGNARFIGNVGWRQNEQTYDAVSGRHDVSEDTSLYYAWLRNANRIFGDDHPVGDARMQSHLFNATTRVGETAQVTGYWYYLDFDGDSGLAGVSTSTVGARVEEEFDIDDMKLRCSLEVATQKDAGANPVSVEARYHHATAATKVGPVDIKVGHELLEGSRSGVGAFSTPLATLHAFNGWADKFLATPGAGLEDAYLALSGNVDGTKLAAIYHDFQAEANSRDFGWELDLLATAPIDDKSSWGAKYADFHARDFATDSRKIWLWYETRF